MSAAAFRDRPEDRSPATPAVPGKYLSVTSFRRDGTGVATPVWFVQDSGRLLVETDANSYKVKRIRRNPSVTIAPCSATGRLRAEPVAAHAELLPDAEIARVEHLMARKYRLDLIFIRPCRWAKVGGGGDQHVGNRRARGSGAGLDVHWSGVGGRHGQARARPLRLVAARHGARPLGTAPGALRRAQAPERCRAGTPPGDAGRWSRGRLVGIDGSPEAAAALMAALDLLGPRLGRLTLAAVTRPDGSVEQRREVARSCGELERRAAVVEAWRTEHAPLLADRSCAPELVLEAGRLPGEVDAHGAERPPARVPFGTQPDRSPR